MSRAKKVPGALVATAAVAATEASTAAMPEQLPGVPAGLPAERVDTHSLGTVVVRGALFTEYLADELLRAREGKPQAGETEEQAHVRFTADKVVRMLARQVLGPDGAPLKSVAEWNAFGAAHRIDTLALFNAAERLSGSPQDAAKN